MVHVLAARALAASPSRLQTCELSAVMHAKVETVFLEHEAML